MWNINDTSSNAWKIFVNFVVFKIKIIKKENSMKLIRKKPIISIIKMVMDILFQMDTGKPNHILCKYI